jgi:hypothetical protein
MVRRGPLRRTLATVAALLISALAAGCVSMPTGGPVRSYPVTQGTGAPNQPNVQFQPQPPRDGWSPKLIVQGFLAASASFDTYGQEVALKYLTPQAQKDWSHPTWSAMVYRKGPDVADPVYPPATKNANAAATAATAKTATVHITGTIQTTLLGNGTAVPSASATTGGSYSPPPPFQLTRDPGGQWRISFAPPQLLLTSSSFANDYQLRNLYFLDPTNSTLVPDPIYVPLRAPGDLMNGLVKDLITPPKDWLSGGATKTALPADTKLAGVTVDGEKAVVKLTGSIAKGGGDPNVMALASSQLLWTLIGPGQSGSTGAVQSVEVELNGRPWFPPGSPGNPVQQKHQSKKVPAAGATPVYYYIDSAGWLTSGQGTTGTPKRLDLIGTGYSQVAVSPSGSYLAALRGGVLYTGLVGGALKKWGSGYVTMSWDGNDNLWAVQGDQVTMIRVTVTVRQPLGRPVSLPVGVGYVGGPKNLVIPFTALRVAPDGVRVALVTNDAMLTFGAISGQQGSNPQITLSQVQLSPQDPATAFSGLAWYGPDNVIATATPGPVATEYSVSGGTPTPIPVEPGMQTITASYGNPLLAGMPDGSIVADVSLTGAWATLGKGVAPAYPG